MRLPKEYRLPGTEVRVSRVGNKVVLEPLEALPSDVDGWWERLDALGAGTFLQGPGPRDDLLTSDASIDFD